MPAQDPFLESVRKGPSHLLSASELHGAADLSAGRATLVHDNERRWRTSRARVEELVEAGTPS